MLMYLWLVVLVAAIWLYSRQKPSKAESVGVKKLPALQVLKNFIWLLCKREHVNEEIDRCYKTFPDERFISRFDLMTPFMMVKDIELIKRITIKDFDYFLDHRNVTNDKIDPIFARSLVSLRGHEWKDMRSMLSPAFTSSKIRNMVPFMTEVSKQMAESLKRKIQESDKDYIDVDVKDLTTRYANDVIATCAFGLNVDSQTDENNQFYMMGKRAVNFEFLKTFLKFLLLCTVPKIMEKLKISLIAKDVTDFFKSLVMDTISNREEKKIIRPDMIHLLMEAKKGKLEHEDKTKDADAGFATVEESVIGQKKIDREWSDNDLIAQAILFLLAGFETVSVAMSFALHELAVNPDVQERLVKEVQETDAKNGGKLDYSSIQNMTYMDMVVSEVLRLWPPAGLLDRLCTKGYNLGKANDDPGSTDYYMAAGEAIGVPVYSIHRDPQYYPDPLKFDPDRFSGENKHKIQPFTYLPFGTGPRNCIGSRFALCEVKVMLYQLLKHMELSPNKKTCIPSRISSKVFSLTLMGGHWVRFRNRS